MKQTAEVKWNIIDTRDNHLATEYDLYGPGSFGTVIVCSRKEEAEWVAEKLNARLVWGARFEVVEAK